MKVVFRTKWLLHLYETGDDVMFRRLPPGIVEHFLKVVQIIEAAACIEDFFRFTSLHFERLHGMGSGLYSLRLNKQYRLIIEIDNPVYPMIATIINIEDYHR